MVKVINTYSQAFQCPPPAEKGYREFTDQQASNLSQTLGTHGFHEKRLVHLLTSKSNPDDPKGIKKRRGLSERIELVVDRDPDYDGEELVEPGFIKDPPEEGRWGWDLADEWEGATSDNVKSLGREASQNAGLDVCDPERDPAPQRHWPGDRQLLIRAAGNKAPTGLPKPRVRLALKLRYARLWRSGDKWYEIRLVTDLGVGTKVGDVIELEHLGLCVVSCTVLPRVACVCVAGVWRAARRATGGIFSWVSGGGGGGGEGVYGD